MARAPRPSPARRCCQPSQPSPGATAPESPSADHAHIPTWAQYIKWAVAGLVLAALALLLWDGGARLMGAPADGLTYLTNTGTAWLLGLSLSILTLLIVFAAWLHRLVMPFFEELEELSQRWWAGSKPTDAESRLALAWAIETAGRLILLGLILSAISTPYG